VLGWLAALRQHQHAGRRSPHKPLLALLALGRLFTSGSSSLSWTAAEAQLGALIAEFGPASTTGRAQSAAYPFTRLRSDGVWVLDRDVPMDAVGPLAAHQVVGRLHSTIESVLAGNPGLILSAACALAESHFPDTVAADVLAAAGFDPHTVLRAGDRLADPADVPPRGRDASWRDSLIQAWDRQCAFCGFDGQVGGGTVGLDAAHVRWFAFDGPDTLDNGLALCVLHHKLFDRAYSGLITRCESTSQPFTAHAPRPDGPFMTCMAGRYKPGPAPDACQRPRHLAPKSGVQGPAAGCITGAVTSLHTQVAVGWHFGRHRQPVRPRPGRSRAARPPHC
jgi:putative restriction endonuclease